MATIKDTTPEAVAELVACLRKAVEALDQPADLDAARLAARRGLMVAQDHPGVRALCYRAGAGRAHQLGLRLEQPKRLQLEPSR
jgi:hypothetical protein